MFKVRGSVGRIKNLPKYMRMNSYSFTPEEAGITSLPRSMFVPSIIAVSGSTPAFIVGSVMTHSSVLEWGVPLLAAAFAGISTPFGMYASRQKKLRKEVSEGLSALLPQIILEGAPVITEDHAALLLKGQAVEVRLPSGSIVAIRLGGKVFGDMDEKTAGTVYLMPGSSGTQELDVLLSNLGSTDPDVGKALRAATKETNSNKLLPGAERPALSSAPVPDPTYLKLVNRRPKVQKPHAS